MYQSGMRFIIILKHVGTHTCTCTYLHTHIHKRGNGYSSCISSHTSQCMLLQTPRLCSFQGQMNEWQLSTVEWYWRKLQYLERNVSQCHSSHQKSHRDWLWNEEHLQNTMPTANDLSHNMVLVYFKTAKPTVHNSKYTYSC